MARDENHVYLKGWDEQDHHSLMLTGANRYGLEHVRLQDRVDRRSRGLRDHARAVRLHGRTDLAAGTEVGQGEAIRFDSPTGHTMEIYAQMEKVGNGLPLFNPPPMPMDLVGIAPPRLDHCLLTTENVPDAARFMSEVLGFRLTEQLVTNEGYQLIVFFERSAPAARHRLHPRSQRWAAPLRLLARQLGRDRAGSRHLCG